MTNRMSIFTAAAAVVILAGCSNFDGQKSASSKPRSTRNCLISGPKKYSRTESL